MPGMLACYPIKNSQWKSDTAFSYEDVFDPAYHAVVEKHIEHMVNQAGNNKNIMGYYWNDIPQWSLDKTYEKRGTNWLILSLTGVAVDTINLEFLVTSITLKRALNLSVSCPA